MKTMIRAALVAATTPFVPAAAEMVRATAVVATRDLDLSTAHDRHRLDRRLAIAAREVCGEASRFDIVGARKAAQCRGAVLEAAASRRDALVATAAGVSVAAR